MRGSQPDQIGLGDGEDAPLKDDSIVRRFPRIGAQFQTRISKSAGQSVRTTPERMSIDFPYISEKEALEQDRLHVNGMFDESNDIRFPKTEEKRLVEC